MYQAQVNRNKYLETSVQTATPAQLLIMLYDGAIRFCRAGIEGIKENNFEKANLNLCKAQNIISELATNLDKNIPLSTDLSKLYEYFNHRLIEANTKKSVEPAEEVLGYLMEFKETWAEASKKAYAQAAGVANG